ncbi:efflux RND transporter periplasmic adaptor subunit [Dyadobacter fermentans]|uniref:Efflux transporter, RND family, MFP subunit n=1 Tax=Dyadobacter fermentans (strain ATCC 700827 / DSM 18053 / CIP 107007 / KCTC 52180 / NS114) TaxID=471854 RepID=C6W293_DYAFD|nr:efflux RND transporter periplasmic adaptor subunit [Dyadobacter fermentans]ACT92066.1 efflux transporter, RND family, MFP subunit [Dyadobacter fermentans DSM 18053]
MFKRSFKSIHFLTGLWLLSASTALLSCTSQAEQGQAGQMPPQETDFIEMTSGSAPVQTSYPGSIEGSVNVDVKAQVNGYLEAIYVKEGDYVQKGQSLFKIKGEVFNEQVNNSSAGLESALAAEANAALEVEKLRPLVEGKVVSDMQLKTAQASYEAAKAQVAQAKAMLGSSKINADFALIKAPVSGYIGRIPNRVGNLVTPADAMPLTTLSEINNVFVYFSMSEADFIGFKKAGPAKDQVVELIMADGSTYTHKGKLESASGNLDRTTGSMSMKAVFPNPDKILRSGGSGRIVIHQTLDKVMTLPMASVKDIQDRLFVYKLGDSSKVAMVPIEVAGTSGNNYLVKAGLQQGDKVALNRIDVLYEGTPVAAKMVPADSLSK